MKSTSRLLIIILFFMLLGSGMLSFSQGHVTLSAILILTSAALIIFAIISFDKRRSNLKSELISFANSKGINPEYIFIDVNLAKAVGIDKKNNKVISYCNNGFEIEDLNEFSGAEIEKSNNSNVIFYRKSATNPVLKIQIRSGQYQDYSSYIQTVFE